MKGKSREYLNVRRVFQWGLDGVEFAGLLVIAFATTVAMVHEVAIMISNAAVTLSDLLLMFLYLEVLAMIGRYFSSGQMPVRFPLYIAMVALARYLTLDLKEMTEWRMLAVAGAIVLLTLAVLVVRFGHVRFPYAEDDEPQDNSEKPFVKE